MKFFFVFFLAFTVSSYAQQRISLDISYRKSMLNTTLGFHKVAKNNWLISGGITYGGKGRTSEHYLDYSTQTNILRSSYASLQERIIIQNENFDLKRYDTKTNVFTAQLGLGYFLNFDIKHGVRAHINLIYGYALNDISAYFQSDQGDISIRKIHSSHIVSAFNTEIYHTIQVWKKLTFYYGLKIPYILRVDRGTYHPLNRDENMFGLEPELSLGITFLIGQC